MIFARRKILRLSAAALGTLWILPVCIPARAAQASPAAPGMREVTDETGRRVVIPVVVRRIVSIAPNLTETIYALGAQDHLVGDTDYCDYPPEARLKPHVGNAMNPSLEEIVALKPDLVLAAANTINRLPTVQALERIGVSVYATDPHTVQEVIASIERVADLIGVSEQGKALASRLKARLEALQQRLAGRARVRALFVVWDEPFISIGPRSFLADALRWAGAESVINSRQLWPQVSLEEVVRQQPDYLIFASGDRESGEHEFESLAARPAWRELRAVRERHLAIVSDAINRPAPRLVDAIEQLARDLRPEAFAEKPAEAAR